MLGKRMTQEIASHVIAYTRHTGGATLEDCMSFVSQQMPHLTLDEYARNEIRTAFLRCTGKGGPCRVNPQTEAFNKLLASIAPRVVSAA